MDETKKAASAEKPCSIPYSMHGGRIVGRILKEHGIKYAFGVHGGHVWPFETGFYEFGIERIHLRHEQTGPYAAEAYARCTRTPGICYGTAGPGFTNMISGIAQAYYNRAPIIAFAGQHTADGRFGRATQECYPEQLSSTITRWSLDMEDWRYIPLYLNKALHDCMVYPPRPIVLSMNMNCLLSARDEKELVGDVPVSKIAPPALTASTPAAVEKAVKLLLKAERPLIAAGEGIHWADAASELQELVELLNIPVHTRRIARGAVSEEHRLAVRAGYRGRFWKNCDVLAIVGLQLGGLEQGGTPPVWPANAKRIVIHESEEDAWQPIPSDLLIIGSPKMVLQQMIDCARTMVRETPKRTVWLKFLEQCRTDHGAWQEENQAEYGTQKPIHNVKLAKDIADFLDPSATIVYDAFAGSAALTDSVKAKFSGQILDCGIWGGVGHGVGMGIGAQLARPGKQVLVLMGDGGMGVGGMDIETASRYNLPIVYVVCNNSTWLAGSHMAFFKGQAYPWDMLPNIGYDKMFEQVGCYGETVADPADITPALGRAFDSGKTAVINVLTDPRVWNPWLQTWAMTILAKLCADTSKLPDDFHEFVMKGAPPEVLEELRGKGYPILKPSKASSRQQMATFAWEGD
ncbi:MAG: thiamine pyrophosphate-binding protein [Dehalococcoidia bacterium]|nr:thiamine pyrophosphate-binding protein [Dehalococcoidia bacterium]